MGLLGIIGFVAEGSEIEGLKNLGLRVSGLKLRMELRAGSLRSYFSGFGASQVAKKSFRKDRFLVRSKTCIFDSTIMELDAKKTILAWALGAYFHKGRMNGPSRLGLRELSGLLWV